MKSGYDQFFKNARKISAGDDARPTPKVLKKPAPSVSTEDLVKKIAENMKQKSKVKRKMRKPIPWKLVGASFLGLLLAGAGLSNYEYIEKNVKKIEISLLGGEAQAEEKVEKKDPATEAKGKEGDSKAAEADKAAEVKKEYTPEEINHFSKLNERKRELDAREEELARAETEIAAQKTELEKKLSELEQTRRQISSVLEEKVKSDEKKIETLVQMYSNMKAQQAAKVFETMDEDLAVDILGRMKKKTAAEVMGFLKPEKAQIFTEKYAGYKRSPAAGK